MITFANWQSALDPDLAGDPAMAELVAKWRARAGGDGLPAWRSFDVVDFRGWYGHLLVSDHGDGESPFCRLFGSKLSDLFGADFSQRHPAELFGGQQETVGRAFAEHLELVRRQQRIGFATFEADTPLMVGARTRVLSLPFAGELIVSAFDLGPRLRPPRFDPANAALDD